MAKVFLYNYYIGKSLDKGNIIHATEQEKKDLPSLIEEALSYGYDIHLSQTSLTQEHIDQGNILLFFSNKGFSQR